MIGSMGSSSPTQSLIIDSLIFAYFIVLLLSCFCLIVNLVPRMTTIQPGAVVTKFAENAQFDNLDTRLEGVDELTVSAIKEVKSRLLGSLKDMAQQSEDIAKVILEAITSKCPHARYMTNPKYTQMLQARYSDLTGDALIKISREMFLQSKKP